VYVLYDFENQHREISLYSINKIVVVIDMQCVFGDVEPYVLNGSEMHYMLHRCSSVCPGTRATASCYARFRIILLYLIQHYKTQKLKYSFKIR
jgi:hypothetical protein